MENETELILFEGANNRLLEMGVAPDNESIEKLKNKLKELDNEKSELNEDNNSFKNQLEELIRQQTLLTRYFGIDPEKEKEKLRKRENEKQKNKGKSI